MSSGLGCAAIGPAMTEANNKVRRVRWFIGVRFPSPLRGFVRRRYDPRVRCAHPGLRSVAPPGLEGSPTSLRPKCLHLLLAATSAQPAVNRGLAESKPVSRSERVRHLAASCQEI